MKVRRSPFVFPFLLFAALAGILSAATSAGTPPSLQIVREINLASPAFQWAWDVRWAGEGALYLGMAVDGVVEIKLGSVDLPPKEMIPGASKPGGFWAVNRLAASSRYLVAAGPALLLTWRRLDDPRRIEHPFEGIQAIDVLDDRLAVLGIQRNERNQVGADGAIAWIGSLDKQLSDLKPFLYDAAGPGARAMRRCIATPLGSVRFRADGSLIVVPGVQPGVQLYDSEGRLAQTWDTTRLGIDADCSSLSDEQYDKLARRFEDRHAWINQRQTVDALLPLEQGPGLVVRRVEGGRTRWDLKLLRRDGSIETYRIPVEGSNEFFHLKGDVRSGKIVFLLSETVFRGGGRPQPASPRLILAQMPPL